MINMPIASARVFVYALGLTIAFCAGAWVGYQPGAVRAERAERALAMAQRDAAQQVAISEAKAREAERKAAERIAEIEVAQAAQQERIEREVEARTRDLRAGNLRLRREIAALATASVSQDAAAAAESEAAAARGAELVAAAIGVGAACDARIQALIEAYDAARGGR